jgi:glutathione synthase/RimK-type ligase-like ATP-grasp enzyme
MRVALVNSRVHMDQPRWNAPLVAAFAARGDEAVEVAWDDDAVDWPAFGAAVVRCTWDYCPRRGEFLAWARRAGSLTPLFNAPRVLEWNSHKAYLLELEERGVPVVPTVLLEAGSDEDAESLWHEHGWPSIVLKPAVGAGARDTFRVRAGEALPPEFRSLLESMDYLLQPYVPSIETGGESSLLFFGGAYSHAVSKVPRVGDYRVQVQHGGEYSPFNPSSDELAFAKKILGVLDFEPLYARIDYVSPEPGTLWLMELELIEPDLYLQHGPGAAEKFAAALADRLAAAEGRAG